MVLIKYLEFWKKSILRLSLSSAIRSSLSTGIAPQYSKKATIATVYVKGPILKVKTKQLKANLSNP